MALELEGATESDAPMDEAVESTETEVQETTAADDSPATTETTDVASGGGDDPEVSTGADEELVQLAQMYGLDAGDPKTLAKRMAVYFDSEMRQLAQQYRQPRQEQQTPAQAKPTAAEQAAFELAKLLPAELPEGEWDDTLRSRDKQYQAAFKAMHDHYGQRLSSLKDELTKPLVERLEAMERDRALQVQEKLNNDFESFFAKQDAEWSGEFGKSQTNALSPHSPQYKARENLWNAAQDLMYVASQRGQRLEFGTALERAKYTLYADKVTTTARKQLASQLAANKNRALGTPKRKLPKPIDPEARAKAVLIEKLRQYGGNTATVQDDDE